MKHRAIPLLIIIMGMLFVHAAYAQSEQPVLRADSVAVESASDSLETLPLAGRAAQFALDTRAFAPELTIGGYGLGGLSPWSTAFDGTSWRLHEGFNAQFGMSVSAGLGKHSPKGVGFGQSAAFAYVYPVTPKLSFAAGLFATNYDWGSWRRTDVGVAGIVAYEVNDRINLYAYGSKSFLPKNDGFRFRRDPFPVFLEQARDRIGAAAEFKIGNNAMIGVSVERASY